MSAVLVITLILGALFFLWALVSYVRGFTMFAPWVPSSARYTRKVLEFLSIPQGSSFVDLGCGDGRIVFLAHRKFKLKSSGFEISLLPFLVAKLRQLMPNNRGTVIELKNFFKVSLAPYDVLYVYGLPEHIKERLLPKINAEVKSGAVIISYNFSLPGKTPLKIFRDRWRNVFIYKI